jgi:beta-lactamase class A
MIVVLLCATLAGACDNGADRAVRIEPAGDGGTAAAGMAAASGVSTGQHGVAPEAPYQFLTATDPVLERVVRTALDGRLDHYSVVVKELTQGTGVAINADRAFYAASLFKLGVMYEAYRQAEAGQLPLDKELTVTREALADDLGTLEKVQLEVGDRLTVGRLIELMVIFSDNTSSVLLRDALDRQTIDRTMRGLGLRSTSVATPELPTTAADMAILGEAIATGRGVSQPASKEMTQMLLKQSVRGRIPAGIPAGIEVANKTGTWEDVGHDVAIVYAPSGTYVIAVLSDLTVRDDLIAQLSGRVYAHYAGRGR